MRDSTGIISGDDLEKLVNLWGHFEGASDPLSRSTSDAEYQFNSLVEKLHKEKVLPLFSPFLSPNSGPRLEGVAVK